MEPNAIVATSDVVADERAYRTLNRGPGVWTQLIEMSLCHPAEMIIQDRAGPRLTRRLRFSFKFLVEDDIPHRIKPIS